MNQQAMAEAAEFRQKAEELQDDYESTIQNHGQQMSELEEQIQLVKKQLEDAEKQREIHREEARLAKLKEQQIA